MTRPLAASLCRPVCYSQTCPGIVDTVVSASQCSEHPWLKCWTGLQLRTQGYNLSRPGDLIVDICSSDLEGEVNDRDLSQIVLEIKLI